MGVDYGVPESGTAGAPYAVPEPMAAVELGWHAGLYLSADGAESGTQAAVGARIVRVGEKLAQSRKDAEKG